MAVVLSRPIRRRASRAGADSHQPDQQRRAGNSSAWIGNPGFRSQAGQVRGLGVGTRHRWSRMTSRRIRLRSEDRRCGSPDLPSGPSGQLFGGAKLPWHERCGTTSSETAPNVAASTRGGNGGGR